MYNRQYVKVKSCTSLTFDCIQDTSSSCNVDISFYMTGRVLVYCVWGLQKLHSL